MPTLSVIIPAYNRERTIAATVESVLACGADAEIVVVDDGSQDGTREVVRKYSPPVIVVEQENRGPSAARNSGFAQSSGDVVAFLDSDDVWLPGVAPNCLRVLGEHPEIDVLFCDTQFGNEAMGYQSLSSSPGPVRFEELLTQRIEENLFLLDRNAFVAAMIHRNRVFLGSAFFRREAIVKAGGFDPDLFGGEDYEFCLRSAASHRFAFLARPLAQYEKHPGGLSSSADRMAREFALAILKFTRLETITPLERRRAFAKYRALAFGYGYRAYDRGDYAEAANRFSAALRNGGFYPRSVMFWMACRMPAPILRVCRRIWQGLHR